MRILLPSVLAAGVLAGCAPERPSGYQGYLEGEFIYVAAPLPGRLDQLSVQKGASVAAAGPLFALESDAETAALRRAESEQRAAEARLADLRKGSRPTELAALEARLAQARSTAELSRLDFTRLEALHRSQVVTESGYDQSRIAHERNQRIVEEIEAQLATSRLGARSDAVVAGEAAVAAAEAARESAAWQVAQKRQAAPIAGLVYDTLYRPGEFVPAGRPVVVLLPPENIKARFFVPESELGALKTGDPVRISISGQANPITGRINYIAPKPEFTPPVLYNRENRSKLVFLVEATIEAADARTLHPGQPVDVAR